MGIKIEPTEARAVRAGSELDTGYKRAKAQGGGIQPGAKPEYGRGTKIGNPMKQIGGLIRKATEGARQKAEDRAYTQKQWDRVDKARAIKGRPSLPRPK